MCSSAPDTSGLQQAALDNAGVAKDALAFYKQQYADQAPLRQQATETAQKVSEAQLEAMGTATDQAKKDANYRETVFQPLERGIVSDAESYDTPEREEQAAGKAVGDVQMASAGARASGARDLTRAGVNPADGAYGAMERSADIGTSLGSVDAANKARLTVQTIGRAMKSDAANLGRGLASSQATQAGIALTAGNNATTNATAPVNIAQSGESTMGQGYNTAISGNNSAGNLYGKVADIQNAANTADAAEWGALGSVAGAGVMKYSDKRMKKAIKPIRGEVALSAVRQMPAKSWKYKATSPANDGGKTHVGPMAQDVRAALGNAAAPGGKMINRDSVGDVTLAAVQALDKKVTALSKKRA